ncbi:MAG TPA: 3-oxoacyl-ACP reductase family protein [Acidobacteriota bacterium]|nr:3-oxoacyl-ACP reductase family protein [Acidobacteriota bacterium]HQF87917.1 3-oxoacyl-ACP reductase family protein [Acidobacteriota bacterium]HQG92273.1 3-oxoacyl-ACP reductase family protein [Acidobacteriota bacterium]HQK87170.1 3-oxoacyl-ACP reductase family protein [Acidobacteriota bacterium]
MDLSGRTALVTGASRGIGRAIARALAEAGADVLINYARSATAAQELAAEIASLGRRAEAVAADVADPAAVEAMFERLAATWGSLDILVNNAGVIRDNLVGGMDVADWDRVQSVNLRGAFLCTRAAAALMVPRHAGKIVNVASVSALRGGRGQTNYAAAKGGLLAFTRACAVELAPKGIQVNAVVPGLIATDMSARVRQRAGVRLLQSIPAGRFGEPADVAPAVVFLASPAADYISGQALGVDGGMTVA